MITKPAPPIPTLQELHETTPWIWLYCADHQCGHHIATTLAWAVIKYGPDASTNVLRENARCAVCGKKGALIQLPSWHNAIEGVAKFPIERAEIQQ